MAGVVPDRAVSLDDYSGLDFELWSSTPAVLWTANRPQEKEIHVHIYEKGRRVVDDTFGTVVYKGRNLTGKLCGSRWSRTRCTE